MIYWLTTIKSQIARKTFKQNSKKKNNIRCCYEENGKKILWVATMKIIKKKLLKGFIF